MKTRSIILTFAAVLFTVLGNATKYPTMNVVSVEQEKALVTFDAGGAKNFEVTIKDQRGESLYFKKTQTPEMNYKTVFDFSDLVNGTYSLNINYDNCTIHREMTVDNGKLRIGNEVRLFEPFYKVEGNKVYVTVLNPALKNVYLNVYGEGEHLVHKNLGKEMAIHKCFDLSKLEKGDYQFVLSDWYNEHSFAVQK